MVGRLVLFTALIVALVSFAAPRDAGAVVPINFTRGNLTGSGFSTASPTALAFGPDGRLYVADNSGVIRALTVDTGTMTVTAVQQITTSSALQEVYGIAFDPNDASSPPPLYVTNTVSGFGDAGIAPAGSFLGKVTKISGPGYATLEDVITGLPVGNSGHQANGLVFGPADGQLYVAQGSMTNAGVVNPGSGLFQREEVPTSGAMLVADIHAAGYDGDITYNPPDLYSTSVVQASGDVSVYAAGLRNPYDMIFHSNGLFYNTDNGPNAGYGPSSVTCSTDNGGDAQAADELNIIVAGAYYGHPNRNRGLAGDARQCTYHAGTESSDAEYTAPIALLPASSNGLAEYTASTFEGQMLGDLVYVSWVENTLHRVRLNGSGQSVVADTTLATAFANPLDVVVGPGGIIYVAEWGGSKITYLKPDETPATSVTVTGIQPSAGPVSGGQAVTITGTNFTTSADTAATIDGVSVTNLVVQNSTTITAVTPAGGSIGAKNVVVTNSIGAGTLTNGYTYAAGGGTIPPIADAGPDWSGPIAHENHAHVTLDARNSTDPDGFIVSYEWREGATVLSTSPADSKQFPLGEHLVTLEVTDNDGYTDTDEVRVIVTLTAENPLPYFCFDVDGDTDVDATDVDLVGSKFGGRFASTGYTGGYGRMYDWTMDRVVNSGDVMGTLNDATASCPQTDREIREAAVWMEQYQNINEAFADNFVQVTQFIPGMGRHLVKAVAQDDIFIAGEPEALLYEPDSTFPGGWRLAGAMWMMPWEQVPLVPEGFTGNEDAWHYHNGLCFIGSIVIAQETTQSQCFGMGGNIWVQRTAWLLHLWAYHSNPVGRFVEINGTLTQGPGSGAATISVDADPATPGIQTTRATGIGSFTVDIVGSNLGDVAAFNFDLEYDPNVFLGATIGAGSTLDRNPDANQAFLQSTGRAFQCSPPAPAGSVNSNGNKAARISCVSTGELAGAPTGGSAVLASVTLGVIGSPGGGSSLTLKNVNVFDYKVQEIASCAPVQAMSASCAAASITAGGDADGDTISDTIDNCPTVPNVPQADSDGDLLGDDCEASIYGTNPADADTDDDSCEDGREVLVMQFNPMQGGSRSPLSIWDFYDVNGSGKVDAIDIGLVRANYNPAGPIPPEDQVYDRTSGSAPWAPGPPDGKINATDIGLARASFNHSCL